jgi:hypothetical protein
MNIRAKVMTRRIAVATAAVAVAAAGWAFNLPANAEPSPACPQLVASYVANPASRPTLLPFLISNQCSIPTSSTSSSSTSSTSTTVRATTTTTNPAVSACAPLSANYLANPGARSSLFPLFAEFNCPVPSIPGSTTTSSSTSSTSSSSTSSTSTSTTSTTVSPNTAICSSLLAAFVANPAAQSSLLPVLVANNCTVNGVSAGE